MHPWPCSCGLTCTLLRCSLFVVEQTKIFCQDFRTSFRIFSVLMILSCNHCILLSGFFCFQNFRYLSVDIKVDSRPYPNAGILLCMWAYGIVRQHCLSPCGCLQTQQASVWHHLQQGPWHCVFFEAVLSQFTMLCLIGHSSEILPLLWPSQVELPVLCTAPERTLWGERDGTKQLISQPWARREHSQAMVICRGQRKQQTYLAHLPGSLWKEELFNSQNSLWFCTCVEVVQFFSLQIVSVSGILLINTTISQQIKDRHRGYWCSTYVRQHPLNQPSQLLQLQRGSSSITSLEQAQSYMILGSIRHYPEMRHRGCNLNTFLRV